MRTPRPAGTEIDAARMRDWVSDYGGYRVPVTEGRIDRWLGQFGDGDRDLAARVLDVVDFVGNDQIAAAFRDALTSMSGWDRDESRRDGRWFFFAFSSSGGESGDQMLYRFRMANNMSGRQWDALFPRWSELLLLAPGPGDTVILVDDFAGTGEQACRAWDEIFKELLPFNPRVVLVLIAASIEARERILDATDMLPLAHFELREEDRLFNDSCQHFTKDEKVRILEYCRMADPNMPMGYGDCSFVIVLAHKCPNNTIPILHARRRDWEGLFRRHD